jgi:hypothetical protein
VLLVVAGVLLALAVGAWWLDRVAFSPSSDSGVTHSILGDEDIRSQVATVVASADAPVLGQSPAQLKEFVEQIARIPDGSALMGRFVADAHARVIGQSDALVLITADEQVTMVRDERVGEEDSLTLPVQEVGTAAFVRTILPWFELVCLGLALVALVVGVVMRPERGEGTFALGTTFAALAVSLAVFGYLVPLAALPALSDEIWMGVFPRLANHHRNLTLLLTIAALVISAVVVLGTSSRRQRRHQSTPLSVARYRDQHSWSS